MTTSPTHDSEDWLDEKLTDIVGAYHVIKYGNEGKSETDWWELKEQLKRAIAAHYLKPEDVERAVIGARLDQAKIDQRAIDALSHDDDAFKSMSAEIKRLKAQLSKLNREEKPREV